MRRVGYVAAAAHIGVPIGTLRSWVSRRSIPHVRLGARTVLFDLEQLDEWLRAHEVEARTDTASSHLRIVEGGR